jgi:hypothetical protein
LASSAWSTFAPCASDPQWNTELGKAAERATWVSPATTAAAHEVYALHEALRPDDDLTPGPDSWYERQAGGYLGSYLKQMSREERDAFATRLQEIVDGYRGEPEWPV